MKKKRQNLVLIGFVFILSAFGTALDSFNQEPMLFKAYTENDFAETNLKNQNESVLVKTLMLNNWLSISEIHKGSYKVFLNSLVSEIVKRTAIPKNKLLKLSDEELSSIALMYRFLLESKIKSTGALKAMSQQDLLQMLININKEKTTENNSEFEFLSMDENLRIAYQWWLPLKNASLISQINEIGVNNHHFQVKDNHGNATEVLRIVKADEADYKYLGVYHSMVSKNHFELYLAGSNDLKSWMRITNLGNRSHQGDIKKWGTGYILVNEEDKVEGSNNIRVRYYESYNKLCINAPEYSTKLVRQFSKYAEGTPDIREIKGDSPKNSHLLIGFHYFNKGVVDYQAIGVLKNFTNWKAWKDDISNKNIIAMGFKGNIGARSSFRSFEETFVLQEAQLEKQDFSKWRLLIGDGAFYTPLNLKTPKGATSFANPGVTEIGEEEFVFTTFLPSEGNRRQEKGQLLYVSKIKAETTP
tara:strand:- start:15892 stop:17307 length:1416 start_codon:yes stop_codon:yes gene_type:complete